MSPQLLVTGAFILDELIYPEKHKRDYIPGGSVLYSALGASLTGVSVGIVSIVGKDYPTDLLHKLEAKGIDLSGVSRVDQGGCRCTMEYAGDGRKINFASNGLSLQEATPRFNHFPKSWYRTHGIHIGPALYDWQIELIAEIRRNLDVCLSVDVCDQVPLDKRLHYVWMLQQADFVLPSEAEFLLLTGRPQIERLEEEMRLFIQHRLKSMIMKRAEKGVCAFSIEQNALAKEPALTGLQIHDVTGAGDAFCGAFHASWLVSQDLKYSMRCGMIAASFALEGEGCEGLLNATLQDFQSRFRQCYN